VECVSLAILYVQRMLKLLIFLSLFQCLLAGCRSKDAETASQLSLGNVMLGDTSHKTYYPAAEIFSNKPFPGSKTMMSDSLRTAYRSVVKKFGRYAKSGGLQKGDTLKGWWDVYFNKSGTIDGMRLILYNSDLSDTVVKKIYKNAELFIANESIPLFSIYNFHQCGSLTLAIQYAKETALIPLPSWRNAVSRFQQCRC
jgi:hypothetical protein